MSSIYFFKAIPGILYKLYTARIHDLISLQALSASTKVKLSHCI